MSDVREPPQSQAERTPPWVRWVLGVFGSTGLVVGAVAAIDEGESLALLAVSALVLAIAIIDPNRVRAKAGDNEFELSRALQERERQVEELQGGFYLATTQVEQIKQAVVEALAESELRSQDAIGLPALKGDMSSETLSEKGPTAKGDKETDTVGTKRATREDKGRLQKLLTRLDDVEKNIEQLRRGSSRVSGATDIVISPATVTTLSDSLFLGVKPSHEQVTGGYVLRLKRGSISTGSFVSSVACEVRGPESETWTATSSWPLTFGGTTLSRLGNDEISFTFPRDFKNVRAEALNQVPSHPEKGAYKVTWKEWLTGLAGGAWHELCHDEFEL